MACFWIRFPGVTDSAEREIARVPLRDAIGYGPEVWDELVGSSPVPSPFMRWAWHSAWMDAAAPEEVESSFAVVINGSNGRPQALLPLGARTIAFRRVDVHALTWAVGSVGCPDHLEVPAVRGTDLRGTIPLLEAVPWDVIVLSGVAEGAANVEGLTDALAARGHGVRRAVVDACPYLDLPATWDEYLATLSASRRQLLRRKERKLIRESAGVVTDYAPDRVDEGWSRLRALHERRWGGPGALGAPLVDRLLRGFLSSLAERNELWLTTFDVHGEPAAAWCGFAWRDTVYFYQGGRDPKWDRESVGTVLLGAMIRRAIERGYKRFDLLRGRDAYKDAWTSAWRPIYEVVIFRRGWRGAWLRGVDLLGRVRARVRARPEFAVNE